MKTHLWLVFISFGLLAFQCEDEKPDSDCFDSNLIVNEGGCNYIYQPVCGCDSKTYGNSCLASYSGIKTWTSGTCK